MKPIESLESLMEEAHGYQRSMALFTALRLDLFTALADGAEKPGDLARRVAADPRNLSILLNALVATGLLVKSGEKYRNSKVAKDFLADGPRSKRSILLHHLDCWPDWMNLERKLRGGRKKPAGDGGFQENFIRGMEDNARERAVEVSARFPLEPGDRVLDVGGGPGTYALEWARRYPGTEVTVFDVPETLRVTRKILREKGGSHLVRLAEGDFTKESLGGPYNLVWISQILHAYSESECIALLRKARKAVVPGGKVAVQEFLLNEDKTSPAGPAFFSVHMVAVTESGRAYTAGEIAAMLKAAKFKNIAADLTDPRGIGIVTGAA
jgi:ubiquinone/menaquinone biosynthesis C-methylase UbiE